MVISYLRDLVKHVSNLGIGVIKLTGDDKGNVKIQAVESNNKSIVLSGKFSKTIPELEGVIGLSDLGTLEKFVNAFTKPNDTITINREDKTIDVEVLDDDGEVEYDADGNPKITKQTENVITGFTFSRPAPKSIQNYRAMDQRMIPQQFDPKKITWDITVKPSKEVVQDFSTYTGFGMTKSVGAELRNNNETGKQDLYFLFNDAELKFAENITGTMTKKWEWDANNVAALLRRSENADCELKIFNDKGALGISLDSGLAKYDFILPAKSR